jgi:streptogramin lyase
MVLIQLLLPTTCPNGEASQDATAALADTRRELAETFDGLTAYVRAPAKGSWTAPDGHTEQDDVVMVEVVTDRFDRVWWRTFAARLAERFRQDTIHVRAIPIQMLEEDE